MRRRYTMTKEQYAKIVEASKPTPVMYLPGGMPMFDSPQENANRAWKKLGTALGFVWDTVQPVDDDPLSFTAEEEKA